MASNNKEKEETEAGTGTISSQQSIFFSSLVSNNRFVAMAVQYLDPLDIGLITIVLTCFALCVFVRIIYSLLPKKNAATKPLRKHVTISPHQQTTVVFSPLAAAILSPGSSNKPGDVSSTLSAVTGPTLLAATAPLLTSSTPQISATTISQSLENHPPLSRTPGEAGISDVHGVNKQVQDNTTGITQQQLAAIEKTSLDWLNTALIWMHTFEIGIFSASALRQWFEAMNAEAANLASQNRHHGLAVKFRELASSQTPPIITSVNTERVLEDQEIKRSLVICIEWREFSLPLLVCRDEDLLAVPISGDPIANAKELESKMYNITMFVRSIKAKIRINVEPMCETGEVYLNLIYANPPDMIFDVKPTANAEFPYHINLIHLSELLDLCVRTTSIRVCVKESRLFDPSTSAFFTSPQHLSGARYWSGVETPRSHGSLSDEPHTASATPRTPQKPPRLANKQQMLVKIISASFNYMLPTMQRQSNNKNSLLIMDPYCVIETEPPFEKQVTSIVQNTTSPFWDEHFVVYIDDNTTTLILNLYDNLRRDSADSLIGAVRIDVDQIRGEPDLFRQPVMMDILATIVETTPALSGEAGVLEEERAVIVGQLTLAAEILLPQNEIRRRGSFFRESVPKEENPPLPSSVVFPKRAFGQTESPITITPPMSLSGAGGTSSLLNAASVTLNTTGTSQSRLSVSSSVTGDTSRIDLSLQPTIPENMTLNNSSFDVQQAGRSSSFLLSELALGSQHPGLQCQTSTTSSSSRSRTIKITVPTISAVVEESKSLMRKPTVAKIKKNITSFQHWTKEKLEKAGSHLQEPRLSSSSGVTPPPDLMAMGGSDFMTSSAIAGPPQKDKSLKGRIMTTLHNLQPHTRSMSADRNSEFFQQAKNKQLSISSKGSDLVPPGADTNIRAKSPKFFTERLSKTARSLSTSLRKLIGDIQSPLTSCGGGSSRSRAAKTRRGQIATQSLRDSDSPIIVPDFMSGVSRGSTPSGDLEFSTVAPASPGRFHGSTLTGGSDQDQESPEVPDSPTMLASSSAYDPSPLLESYVNERRQSKAILTANSMASRYLAAGAGGHVLSSKERTSLLNALGTAEAQKEANSQQVLRNLPPPVLKNRLIVPDSPSTARRKTSGISPATVTFSPAPFRKTKEGYEQSTL